MQIKIFSIESDRFDELHAISKLCDQYYMIIYCIIVEFPNIKTKNDKVLSNGNLMKLDIN